MNLPRKNNFKNHSGLDAMTGKGNFDIAEFITMSLNQKYKYFIYKFKNVQNKYNSISSH